MTAEVLAFFKGSPRQLSLFEAAEAAIFSCGESTMEVKKTQISWGNPLKFAFLSLLGGDVILTFGLSRRVDHPKIFQAVEPYPGRWTHHVRLREEADLDETARAWLREAYSFAVAKRR